MPPDTPTPLSAPKCPIPPPPQYRHLVVKSGTTAGQHDMSSACRSGGCVVTCIPPPNHPICPLDGPQVEAYGGQE